jgi:hypothetical protein
MIALFVFPLILAFAPAAVWALRVGGLRWLWLLCALALLALLLLALFLSAVYSVPNVWRVAVYFLASVGPSIVFTTCSLAVASAFTRALSVQLITSFAGSLIGVTVGFVEVVYVFGA